MTAKELFEAIGMVDDALILEAMETPARRTPVLTVVRRVLPVAACVCIVAGALLVWRQGHIGSGSNNNAAMLFDDTSGGAVSNDSAPQEAAIEEDPARAAYDLGRAGDGSTSSLTQDTPSGFADTNSTVDELDDALLTRIWAGGEPEPQPDKEQAVTTIDGYGDPGDSFEKYSAPLSAPMAPAWLPIYRNGEIVGYCAGLDQDVFAALDRARQLLAQGVYIQGGEAQSDIDGELIYSPAGSEYSVPFYAFVVEDGDGQVWRYVPAVQLNELRALIGGDEYK